MKRRQNNEAQLEKELGRFFRKLKKEVLKGLDEYWSDYQLLQGQVNLMLSPIHEAHKEYYEIIRKYKLREYELGKAEAKRLTKRANKDRVALKAVTTLSIQGFIDKDKSSLFGTIPKAEEDLLNRTFRTSQNTLNRVDNQLNQIISDGYREGKGINQVANDITKRFDQLADWEARRIARTEINTSHNQATRDQYREDGVEYTQWIAANDDRTRDSHVDVDGEIIPIDGKYSNGLAFPGDTSGPIEEWINCRCSNAPFVIPYGFMAPSFSPFRESDLVPINMESLGEPSQEQLEANLSPEQRSQYEQYTKAVNEAQSIIDSKFSLPRERLQARTQLEYNLSRLNQLKLVANGELARGYQQIVGSIATTPQDQQEAEVTRGYSMTPITPNILSSFEIKPIDMGKKQNPLPLTRELVKQYSKEFLTHKWYNYEESATKITKHYETYYDTPFMNKLKQPIEGNVLEGTKSIYDSFKYGCGNNFGRLNAYYRDKVVYKEQLRKLGETEAEIKQHCERLDKVYDNLLKGMKESIPLTEDTMLFRATSTNHEIPVKVGEIGTFEGFTSTSFERETPNLFYEKNSKKYNVFYKILAPKGTRGTALGSADKLTNTTGQSEWLLPETQYEVKHVVQDGNNYVITVELINQII